MRQVWAASLRTISKVDGHFPGPFMPTSLESGSHAAPVAVATLVFPSSHLGIPTKSASLSFRIFSSRPASRARSLFLTNLLHLRGWCASSPMTLLSSCIVAALPRSARALCSPLLMAKTRTREENDDRSTVSVLSTIQRFCCRLHIPSVFCLRWTS